MATLSGVNVILLLTSGQQLKKASQMTFDEWFDTYKPIPNPTGDSGLTIDGVCFQFETYDPDLSRVLEVNEENPGCVWTLVDGDDGQQYLSEGYHYVNRAGYFITEVPYTGAPLSILFE